MSERLSKIVKAITLRLAIELALFLLALFIFVLIADEIVVENEGAVDQYAFNKLDLITSPGLTGFMRVITFFGSWYVLFPAYLLLIAWLIVTKRKRSIWLDVITVAITSTAVLFSLKAIFHRQRPLAPLLYRVPGFSFPSGHSFSSFVFAALLIYVISDLSIAKKFKWLLSIFFFLFACVIAISRVYLHVHYASDVVAGFFLSIVWVSFSFWVLRFARKKGWMASTR